MSKHDEFVFKNEEFCIKNDEYVFQKTRNFAFKMMNLCSQNEEFCIKNDEFAVLTLLIAWVTSSIFMFVYSMAIDTILLCFCEDR